MLSDLRRKILIGLLEKPMTRKEMRSSLDLTPAALNPKIKRLEEIGLIYESKNLYALTEMGKLVAGEVKNFLSRIKLIGKYLDFFVEHAPGIPPEFMERIYELEGGNIVRASPLDVSVPYREFASKLSESKDIRGISPIFNPSYIELFSHLNNGKRKISLIVTSSVLELLKSRYLDYIKSFIESDNCSIYEFLEDIKIALTVTDVFLSLGLFNKDGTYDTTTDLISEDRRALKWGFDLFELYKKESKKIVL